jgi:hypothetical protein
MTIVVINGCVLFPHVNAWRSKPAHKRVWQTGVERGVLGNEARAAMRAVSRRQVSVELQVKDAERVRLESRIDAAKKSGYGALPLFGRGSYLTAPAAAGANQVSVTTDAWNWQAGDYIILLVNDQTYDIAAINDVAAGVLTLAANLNFSWLNGWPIRPVLFGGFTADKQTVITGSYAAWRITVAELTSSRSAQIGVTPPQVPGVGQQVVGKTNKL